MTQFPKTDIKKERAAKRKKITDYRREQMKLCLALDGRCMNPNHPDSIMTFTMVLDPHHILGRDKKGLLDNVKYLIVLCRWCHTQVERGVANKTGKQIMIEILCELKRTTPPEQYRWGESLERLERSNGSKHSRSH